MAWIKKTKTKKVYKKLEERSDKDIQKIYQSKTWKELRKAYFQSHPLCENCLSKTEPIIRPTEEIHHIKPISGGNTLEEMMDLAYNPSNLRALCKECHKNIHKEMKSGFMKKKKPESTSQRT